MNIKSLFVKVFQELPKHYSVALKLHEDDNFPRVEGMVDGTHIRISRLNVHEETYVNTKCFIQLMYRFAETENCKSWMSW